MKIHPFLWLACLLASLFSSAQTNLFMLSIGVKDQKDPKRNLSYADRDAQDLLAAWSGQNVLFSPQTDGMKILTNEEATADRIRTELAAIKQKVKPGDLFIFFFSGHGTRKGLCPYDYDPKNSAASVLLYEDLREGLRLGCNVLILLDACHSGKFKDKGDGDELSPPDADELVKNEAEMQQVKANMAKLSQGDNYVGLFSSDMDNKSYESDLFQHGYFTQAILDCMAHKPIPEGKIKWNLHLDEGYVEASDFIVYVQKAYKHLSRASRQPQSGESVTQGDGSFKICKVKPSNPDYDKDGLRAPEDHCPEIHGKPENNGCPDNGDSDVDGVFNFEDRCPEEFGTQKAAGCPDADDDGVPDLSDKCRFKAGPPHWSGCPDSDGDGIHDFLDKCPDAKGLLPGEDCPPPDSDSDGIANTEDACPELPGLPGKTEWKGCPDSDADGLPNHEDPCPQEKGAPEDNGCPPPDLDADGVPDALDLCPTEAGSKDLKGCRQPPVETAKNALAPIRLATLGDQLSPTKIGELCRQNPDFRIQQDSLGNIWLLPRSSLATGAAGALVQSALMEWNGAQKKGVVFNFESHFALPNSAVRSPGLAWMMREKWDAAETEAGEFPDVAPDFVAEFCQDSSQMESFQWKMKEWMHNGTAIGWLFDVQKNRVFVFQSGSPVALVEGSDKVLEVQLGSAKFRFEMSRLPQTVLSPPGYQTDK